MSGDLAAFLNARLDEDAAIAEEAASVAGPAWQHGQAHPTSYLRSTSGAILADTLLCSDGQIGPHLARHDPARVLREVEADRALLSAYHAAADTYLVALDAHARDASLDRAHTKVWLDTTAAVMLAWERGVKRRAAVWSDHPDYQPEWKP